jgi:hypothetical protein
MCQEWEDKAVVDSSGKKVKLRKSVVMALANRKRIGGGDSDGDDDYFMPTKKAATAPASGASCPRPNRGWAYTEPLGQWLRESSYICT